MTFLTALKVEDLMTTRRSPVSASTLAEAAAIVDELRSDGERALRRHSESFGDLAPGQPYVIEAADLAAAFESLPEDTRALLDRTRERITAFAQAQLDSMSPVQVGVPGGTAGHRLVPVSSVGAYAPGGRHPLPSSVLMTVVPARVAGVETVTVASPRPDRTTLAAAHSAGADRLLAVGGAQAVAALAFGVGCRPSDLVVGPGNRWVTAAKKYLYGEIGIDGLAGPSEVVVVADSTAAPVLVAADLLAQAEHDPDARVGLVTPDANLPGQVDHCLEGQLRDLPTEATARQALDHAYSVIAHTIEEAADVCDLIAPEHLSLHVADPDSRADLFNVFGSLFVGGGTTEAHADYGIGPNHVLPTGGTARFQSGLSPLTFLRSPTWLRVDDPSAIAADVTALARLEGLEAHARSAEIRSQT